jgi:hypothetical protein
MIQLTLGLLSIDSTTLEVSVTRHESHTQSRMRLA